MFLRAWSARPKSRSALSVLSRKGTLRSEKKPTRNGAFARDPAPGWKLSLPSGARGDGEDSRWVSRGAVRCCGSVRSAARRPRGAQFVDPSAATLPGRCARLPGSCPAPARPPRGSATCSSPTAAPSGRPGPPPGESALAEDPGFHHGSRDEGKVKIHGRCSDFRSIS